MKYTIFWILNSVSQNSESKLGCKFLVSFILFFSLRNYPISTPRPVHFIQSIPSRLLHGLGGLPAQTTRKSSKTGKEKQRTLTKTVCFSKFFVLFCFFILFSFLLFFLFCSLFCKPHGFLSIKSHRHNLYALFPFVFNVCLANNTLGIRGFCRVLSPSSHWRKARGQ